VKETAGLRRYNERLSSEKEKTKKKLDGENGLLAKTQDKLASADNKVKKLLSKVRQPAIFVNESHKN
jgi:hypothetical protein